MGWASARVQQREEEIEQVASGLGIDQVYNLGFPTTRLDTFPMGEVIQKFSEVFRDFEPEEVLIPHRGDCIPTTWWCLMPHQLVASGSGIRRFGVSWPMKRSPRLNLAWIQIPNFTPTSLSILVLFWIVRLTCFKSTKANSVNFPFPETLPQSAPWPSTEAQLQGLKQQKLFSS